MSFIDEIKRRKVIQVAATYAVVAWLLIEIATTLEAPLNLPDWFDTAVIIFLATGFPITLLLSWAFDLTPTGIVRDRPTNRSAASSNEDSDVSGAMEPSIGRIAVFLTMGVLGLLFAGYIAIEYAPPNESSSTSDDYRPVRRLTVDLPGDLRLPSSGYRPILISEDGQRLIFGGILEDQAQLYTRTLDDLEVFPIRGTEAAGNIAEISPDGKWVVFVDGQDETIKKIPVAGGIPTALCDSGGDISSLSWGANDIIVFASEAYPGLMQVPSSGGVPERLTFPEEGKFHKQAVFLPGGESIFFVVGERSMTMRHSDQVAVMSMDTGELKILTSGSSPRPTPNGHLIYFSNNALWAVEFDDVRLSIESQPVPVAENLRYSYSSHYRISDDGTLVYVLDTGLEERSLVWVDRAGAEEAIPIDSGHYLTAHVSPDGDRIVAMVKNQDGGDMWMFTLSRGTSHQLTFDEAHESAMAWSPDGKFFYYSSDTIDNIFRLTADSSGAIERLTESPFVQFVSSVTPDGHQVLFTRLDRINDRSDIGILNLSDDPATEILLESPLWDSNAVVSPDGRWLAYRRFSNAIRIRETSEIFVSPFPDVSSGAWQVSVGGGWAPVWSADGEELFYVGPKHIMAATIDTTDGFESGRPERLFLHEELYDAYTNRRFGINPVTGRFLMVKKPRANLIPGNRIIVVQNWLVDVERKLAAN